jgi:hypothetical protein
MIHAPTEIYLDSASNERKARFYDYTSLKEVEQSYEGKLKNAMNLDLGDLVEFCSIQYGWVEGRVIRISLCPSCKDEFEIEFEDNGRYVREFVEGQFL